MSRVRVLSVGQCGFDQGSLGRYLGKHYNAQVTVADTFEEAFADLRSGTYDLILVNRVTDADGSSGLEMIRDLKADPALAAAAPVMLVSDLERAQEEAVALGALPGFGKSAIRNAKPVAALDTVLSPKA
jgi:two-component system, chemotaxis family, chemotaxis protein CheY